MNPWLGAAYYSSVFGPLPFAIAKTPAVGVRIWRIVDDADSAPAGM